MIKKSTTKRIATLTDNDAYSQTLDDLFVSLAEEFGEVARIINGKPHNEPLRGELADIIICALAMYHVDGSKFDIDEQINMKLDKWEAQIEKDSTYGN